MNDQNEQHTTALAPPTPAPTLATSSLATALAVREKTMIEARLTMAQARPRSVTQFRDDLLKECTRLSFAEQAEYARPVGKEKGDDGRWIQKIARGPSIRLIETALRFYRNISTEVTPLSDDAKMRSVKVEVFDWETCVSFSTVITFEKTEEKRDLGRGQRWISSRTNSYGETVFTVEATDDRVRVKEAALVSKAVRDMGRRCLPGDVLEEAIQKCRDRIANADKEDPAQARRRVFDAFSAAGVKPVDLAEYMGGQSVDTLGPADLDHLRVLLQALREGELRWVEALDASPYIQRADDEKPSATATKARAVLDKAKEALEKKRKPAAPAPAPKDETLEKPLRDSVDAEEQARREAAEIGG